MNKNDLYRGVVNCPLSCNDIRRDTSTHIPRGFYTRASVGDAIDLMLIAINPGQPMKSEINIYASLTPMQQVKRHLNFASKAFKAPYGKTFHKRLVKWISDILNIGEEVVFNRVVYTNLVKCTTPNNKTPQKHTARICYRHHLSKEIRIWNPRMIVALGEAADKYLCCLGIEHHFLPHPSHRKHADYHKRFCDRLRKVYNELYTAYTGPGPTGTR